MAAGLDAGVTCRPEPNPGLAALLLLCVIPAGPALDILPRFFSDIGDHASWLPALASRVRAGRRRFPAWLDGLCRAWWIGWPPFAGMVIACVSQGPRVRQSLVAVLLVPTMLSGRWMTGMDGTASARC